MERPAPGRAAIIAEGLQLKSLFRSRMPPKTGPASPCRSRSGQGTI